MPSERLVAVYRVADVRSAEGEPAPREIAERFAGRTYTLRDLEQRGVRITGAGIWYLALAQDWQLHLDPPL